MQPRLLFSPALPSLKRAALLQPLCITLLSSMAMANPTAAQPSLKQAVTLNAQDATVYTVLADIEKQTDARFQYSRQLIGAGRHVSLKAAGQPLGEVLVALLEPLRIRYTLTAEGIVLRPAADAPVTGRVVDEKGEALPGVNVIVKGTSVGTATGADGTYTINAPTGATLVFSFVGYTAQEVPLNGRTTVDVKFEAAASQTLNDVVVVGYGTQVKREVTGAIASVKGAELVNQSSQNPVSSLQGKVSGVQITNSGTPGGAPQIRVRGTGSIGGVSPLYVVDGTFLPQGADLSFLNQDDIASIEVLKDAASASIYGIQAANGVILVTTRRGQSGAPRINYNGFVGVQSVTNKVEMANASEYATLYNEKNALQGAPASSNLATDLPSTDWFNQLSRKALITNHQLSLSGGSDKISYAFSGSYLKQQGIIKKNDFERITARLQTDFSATDHIKLGYNVLFSNVKSTDVPSDIFYQGYVAPPVVQPFLPSGRYGDPGLIGTGLGSFSNPQGTLDYYNQQSQRQNLVSSVFASFNFLQYFTFRTSVGINYGSTKFYNYLKADSLTTVQVYRGNTLRKGNGQNSQIQWENTLTYDRSFGTDHHLTVLGGTTALRYRTEEINGSINGVQAPTSDFYYFGLGTQNTASLTNPIDLYKLFSVFARVNYAYKGRYLLTASFRRDGSSRYSERYGNFPSVGLGWVVSDESFMANSSIFSFLKLRGSYGVLGNSQLSGSNIATQLVDFGAGYGTFFNGQFYPGATVGTRAAPQLRWENVREADGGVEMRFLDNKLTAEFDYYNRRTIDAVFPVPVLISPGYTNSGGFLSNSASFQNQGVEVALRWAPTATGDFSYNLGLTGAYNQNKVLSTAGGAPLFAGSLPVAGYLATVSQIGAPLGAFYGYEVAGVFQTAADVTGSAQPGAKAGDLRYRDVNGDGVIDNRDKVMLGNPNPRFTYGVNTNFRYKGFDLQIDIQGVGGVEVLNGLREVRYGNENFTKEFYNTRWTGAGSTNSAPSANLSGTNLDVSSYYIEKADYIRLRNVQLGYNFPKTVTGPLHTQTLRLYANAQNPLTLTKYSGFTPEVGGAPTNAGIDLNVYPLSATYNIGINVGF
ncbi:SusC/RagA family TonB-linked outer membrane protein [Hymenobacter nivis]|uniref:TonB-dependent receptor n=1 Tax=Hymenobacter nivis TaxID=1850093 RepID=A0A502GUS3_9BACT|nr:TonB-dependent receptor [Hymenobacter nivis]TPG65395.1 TonB-dependent receptor [Hymenobacter nivis]